MSLTNESKKNTSAIDTCFIFSNFISDTKDLSETMYCKYYLSLFQ